VWHVFRRPQSTSKTPQIATNRPQAHHVFTITKHLKIAKPPAKSTFFPPIFFLIKKPKSPSAHSHILVQAADRKAEEHERYPESGITFLYTRT
jgi:hypothetical protein